MDIQVMIPVGDNENVDRDKWEVFVSDGCAYRKPREWNGFTYLWLTAMKVIPQVFTYIYIAVLLLIDNTDRVLMSILVVLCDVCYVGGYLLCARRKAGLAVFLAALLGIMPLLSRGFYGSNVPYIVWACVAVVSCAMLLVRRDGVPAWRTMFGGLGISHNITGLPVTKRTLVWHAVFWLVMLTAACVTHFFLTPVK